MKTSFGKLVLLSSVAFVLTSLVMPDAEAQRGGRGGGGGGGGGGQAAARQGGGSGGGAAARQGAQANNSRADVRTNDVRAGSVNNVNVQQNVNVNVQGGGGGCSGRCGNGWDHPVAAVAVVGGTIAAIGHAVSAPPPGCVPVNHGGMVYQQCGGTWYAPQGSQFVVVAPPY